MDELAAVTRPGPLRCLSLQPNGSMLWPMPVELDQYFRVGELPGRVLRVTRTAKRFDTVLELERVWTELNRSLDSWRRRGYGLLVDIREAPARNDDEFEKTLAPLRARMFIGFSKRAVLTRTPAGKLQVHRHAREDQVNLEVFAEEPDALAYLVSSSA